MILLLLLSAGCREKSIAPGSAPLPSTIDLTIKDHTFHLELATDPDSRHRGLSDRPSIPADRGMLFVFPRPDERDFVMRQCLVPIDIIFIGPGGRIVAIHEMQVEPYDTPEAALRRYRSGWPAQFAIELPGGTLEHLDLQAGQSLDLPWADLKQQTR